MHCTKKITDDIYFLGASDRRLALFENVFPIPRGVSYNSYLVLDEKTTLLDTVDHAVSKTFFENLEYVLKGRKLDFVVVNHMEPDHCATLEELILRHPEVTIVANQKTMKMIEQFFEFSANDRAYIVQEGDVLETGTHSFAFVMAPMVHWPEVMVTYDTTSKTLFSADAFGTFGALNGNIFADEVNFESEWLPDARRYYTNIVGKYGNQVKALLLKASKLEIKTICPLHGPIWRKDIAWYLDKYVSWSTYTPEEKSVMIAYASVYGDTANAADILASMLADKGIKDIAVYDVSVTHPSVIVSEAFRCSHLVFASTTYNAGIFCNMETALLDLKAHNMQNRTVAIIENGSWAPTSGALMREIISSMKNMTILDDTVSIKSSVKEEQLAGLEVIAASIADSMVEPQEKEEALKLPAQVDKKALFSLSYGLFILSAKDGKKDNACIINTVTQVADQPLRITISVNKANFTHDMIKKTGIFNISVLSQQATFETFRRFGFASGRDTDKFSNFSPIERASNGVLFVTEETNAYMSAKVTEEKDMGSHTLFIAELTHAAVLKNDPSCTYAYYFDKIKPKPQDKLEEKKTGFVCTICGYVYEGDTLPEDFICPICKHGTDVFEKIK